ncbi:hypothetical protein TREMEDRAFT_39562 [Tremella mesenterica DSM 1558]|uniref:uncharacterized protein n=1 Tax=Tremella mesenterica (strain ATCC 24925 / CBS 8224 / DSM 1558 / NBRC 9311 / NRRL Y-6157 / RJB 2259-6 / UBC 559-6) TaxID=578456 RepID=UPI0003F48E83|nr:uncharacterized protein TREMEDRAFT_39562 [Tremella mesenterica DSM 1558]EIW68654.1 hypothetical protein TREMEDRAFT_39562 [Tremella mesenterica DSM 1558]
MSAPPPEVYLAPDFEASTLRVPQLRSILLEYDIPFPSTSKKPELLTLFETKVKPQAVSVLTSASRIKASAQGIISVSENGDEELVEPVAATGAKRVRGKPKKSEVKEATEPPPKKARGRSRQTSETDTAVPPTTRRRGSRNPSMATEDEDAGALAEVEDEATPVSSTDAPRVSRSRRSVTSASPASLPSAPPSSRRRSGIPSSSSVVSETHAASEKSVLKRPSNSKFDNVVELDQLEEISEPEETPIPVSTTKKTPRKSRADESGFSDFNPFQSGSEEAAERERRRRKSSVGLSTSKPKQPRLSEPGRIPLLASPIKSSPAHSSATPSAGILRRMGPSRENLKRTPESKSRPLEEPEVQTEHAEIDRYNHQLQEKVARLSRSNPDEPTVSITTHIEPSTSLVRRSPSIPSIKEPRAAIPLSMLFLLLLSLLANFKSQSSAIGYCDAGSSTNDIALDRQGAIEDARACVARRATLALDSPEIVKQVHCDASALPLIPFLPQPLACTPCPQHAVCEEGDVIACDNEYLLSAHPLSFLAPVFNGLPGVGPEAFPPTCKPDTQKKRMVGGLAMEMEKDLAKGRGLVVCAGIGKDDGRQGEGERFGMEEDVLRERYSSRRDPRYSQEQFNEIFEAALNDLVEHDDVIESIDVDGKSWYAASRTDLTLGCRAKIESVDLMSKWKSQLASSAAVLTAIAWLRSLIRQHQSEKFKAEELAQVVLKRLQDQEYLHYLDPVQTPHSFLPPDQVRDVVMPPSGSTTSRARLWSKVARLIEKNANVAVREQEVRGEVWQTWEWTGVGERHIRFE